MRVLYLDLDTLRPDHLGCYGYHRDTSPNIDRIASEGVRFDRYYCSDAPCLPSRSALMSGQFGIHSGVVNHGGANAERRGEGAQRGFRDALGAGMALPYVFRRAGLRTALISPFAERHAAWWFYAGFQEMHNTGLAGMESAEHVTPTVLKWIEDHASEENWFLHVNYWDPHTPYRAPPSFGNPFAEQPLPEWLTEEVFAGHLKHIGPHSAHEIGMYDDRVNPNYPRHPGRLQDMADVHVMMDGYDGGIRYMDEHIGRLCDALARRGVMDDLTIIVSADHGENMGELGIYGEHGTADHCTCRIPMIVRQPRGLRGHVDRGLHYNLDLAPTLAEVLGVAAHDGWDGQSFAPTLVDGTDCGRDELVVSQCCHVCQRSVLFGSWLYMRTYHDGYHLFPDEMLFEIDADPHEQHDRAAARPDLLAQGARRLADWHDRMMRTMPYEQTVDPLRTVLAEGGPYHGHRRNLKKYEEQLRKTGRAWAIEELRKRHGAP